MDSHRHQRSGACVPARNDPGSMRDDREDPDPWRPMGPPNTTIGHRFSYLSPKTLLSSGHGMFPAYCFRGALARSTRINPVLAEYALDKNLLSCISDHEQNASDPPTSHSDGADRPASFRCQCRFALHRCRPGVSLRGVPAQWRRPKTKLRLMRCLPSNPARSHKKIPDFHQEGTKKDSEVRLKWALGHPLYRTDDPAAPRSWRSNLSRVLAETVGPPGDDPAC